MKNTFFLLVVSVLISFSVAAQIAETGVEYISGTAMSQRALFNYLQRQRVQDYNRATTSGELNPTGDEIQIKKDVHYILDGYFHTLSATDTPGFSADVQASGTRRIYLLSVNADGTATCTAGVAVAGSATASPPNVPADHIPFGYLNVLANDAFTLGTTNFNLTTTTAYNISRLNPLGVENFQGL